MSIASWPSPVTLTGADTAGSTTLCRAARIPSAVVRTGCVVIGTRTVPPWMPRASMRSVVAATSRCWPARGSTATGCVPTKWMVPSIGSRSVVLSSPCRAAVRAARSVAVTTLISRVRHNELSRVHGFSGCLPACSTVAGQSRVSPARAGLRVALTSPASSVIGWLSRGSSCSRSRCSAATRVIPPTDTPATVTPRGTLPEDIARSMK
jgi:hypothetical protein